MSSSTLPPSLKKINVFLKRAEELDRDKSNPESRVVAYNCRQHAVQIGIPLVSSSTNNADDNAAAKASLGELLTTLEKEKQAMSVFSKNEHWKICRKVADRVFEKADSEDRAGVASKGTARSFYAAGTFYEILQQFHDEEISNKDGADLNEDEASVVEHIEEEDQRRIYCKWKATDILTAIKEGRTPAPGGYQREKDDEADDAVDSDDGGGGVTNNEKEAIEVGWAQSTPIHEDKDELPLPPPAPSMSSSDLFEMPTQNSASNIMPPPPPYDGIELSLSGQPTSTTTSTTDHYAQEQNNDQDDLFIPAPPPQKPSSPPPSHSQQKHVSSSAGGSGDNNSNNNGGKGMFSSIFHSNKSSNKKLSKEQMGDAIELTKFALAALQNGDGELGRERLEQALGVW
eukprot:CAMPEP_0201726250 /NCGR_PEP_ID=MMETSP0593-20130828/9345_1 /ASSEMBLY_ACC=CAM_ASM_000672 /TAXON_ID=267983 /ORGANISM="Skeletonema japonicum, Strain CCMP2506" /LENGTH=399 /DNA_ID=CAMNT_0048217721 /DNA_START=84 /DNA_END=1280 /DNA_ORIENTATION=+